MWSLIIWAINSTIPSLLESKTIVALFMDANNHLNSHYRPISSIRRPGDKRITRGRRKKKGI
jgi:hypothetical protein